MNLKKISMLLAAAALTLSLSACAGSPVAKLPILDPETKETSGVTEVVHTKPAGDYKNEDPDGMLGLLTYMEDGKAVVRDTESVQFDQNSKTIVTAENTTSFVQMSFKEIGAVNGYRYQFTYKGSTVQAEFYRFDPENLDDKAKACLSSVREKGFFEVLGNQVPATLHPSGKYLMIYTDGNAEKNEENAAQKAWAEELFLDYEN